MSDRYKVEKGIPIPGLEPWDRRSSVYPWYEMEVGDSFFVSLQKMTSAKASASQHSSRTGRKYVVRAFENGARIWRVQ